MGSLGVILLIYAIGFAAASAYIAGTKGRSRGQWLLLGLLFGIFALVAIAFAAPETAQKQLLLVAASKRCPNCGEDVGRGARICRYCHHRFPAGETVDWGSWKVRASNLPWLPFGTLVTVVTDEAELTLEFGTADGVTYRLGSVEALVRDRDGGRVRLRASDGASIELDASGETGDGFDLAAVINEGEPAPT
jgi:hypothetical protein